MCKAMNIFPHAEWNWEGNGWFESIRNYDWYRCSSCGNSVTVLEGDISFPYKFCPHCGATMSHDGCDDDRPVKEIMNDVKRDTAEFYRDMEREIALLKTMEEEKNGT